MSECECRQCRQVGSPVARNVARRLKGETVSEAVRKFLERYAR